MDVWKVIESIRPVDVQMGQEAIGHINNLTKPVGSLGEIERVAMELCKMTGTQFPDVFPPGVIVFAADHGIAAEGVSAYPQEVTAQMVANFASGGAAVNVFTNHVKGLLEIVDVGVASNMDLAGVHVQKVGYGTKNFAKEPAMTRDEALLSIKIGMERAKHTIERGARLLIVGEMGIANTTSASAIVASLAGVPARTVVGTGTGIPSEKVTFKAEVIEKAIDLLNPDPQDPIDLLSKVGGFEIGAMCGAMLYAASKQIPILLDGFICTSAALLATRLSEHVKEYMLAGHQSVEPGHKITLDLLEKKPLLTLNMRLGEGSGAVLAYPLVQAAAKMLKEMATFEGASVSKGTI